MNGKFVLAVFFYAFLLSVIFFPAMGQGSSAAIDLYTQKEGVGFELGEKVILTALVTYNEDPRPGILVTFKVYAPEYYLWRVKVTDSDGLASVNFTIPDSVKYYGAWNASATASVAGEIVKDTITFEVLDMTDPVADAGPDMEVDEDELVTFDGSGSWDNVGIINYTWTFMDITKKTLTGVKPTYTFATPSVYDVTLNVTDAAGNYAIDTLVVTVLVVTIRDVTSPVADAGPDQVVKVGTVVTFNASGSTDNVGIVSYEWNFGDGATGTGLIINHTYTEPGTYIVMLTVRDAVGNRDIDALTVTVEAVPTPPPRVPAGFPLWILIVPVVAVGIILFIIYFVRVRKK